MTVLQRVLLSLAAIPALCFLGDEAVLRFRGSPTAAVVVKQYYAIPIKGNKVQYLPAESSAETCVEALFPHQGRPPCWYTRSHARRQIDM